MEGRHRQGGANSFHRSWNLTIWNQETRLEPRVPVCLGQWGRGSLESLQLWYWAEQWFGGHHIKVEEETIPASQGTFRVLGHSFCKEEAAERSGQKGIVMRLRSDFRIE